MHEVVAASPINANYTFPLDRSSRSSSELPRGTSNPLPLDPDALAVAVAAHKAEGERLRLALLDQERIQKEATERVEATRHASMYRDR